MTDPDPVVDVQRGQHPAWVAAIHNLVDRQATTPHVVGKTSRKGTIVLPVTIVHRGIRALRLLTPCKACDQIRPSVAWPVSTIGPIGISSVPELPHFKRPIAGLNQTNHRTSHH